MSRKMFRSSSRSFEQPPTSKLHDSDRTDRIIFPTSTKKPLHENEPNSSSSSSTYIRFTTFTLLFFKVINFDNIFQYYFYFGTIIMMITRCSLFDPSTIPFWWLRDYLYNHQEQTIGPSSGGGGDDECHTPTSKKNKQLVGQDDKSTSMKSSSGNDFNVFENEPSSSTRSKERSTRQEYDTIQESHQSLSSPSSVLISGVPNLEEEEDDEWGYFADVQDPATTRTSQSWQQEGTAYCCSDLSITDPFNSIQKEMLRKNGKVISVCKMDQLKEEDSFLIREEDD